MGDAVCVVYRQVWILFALNLLLSLFLVYVKVTLNTVTPQSARKLSYKAICVPCKSLYFNKIFADLTSFSSHVERGEDVCCPKTAADIDRLVDLTTERKLRKKLSETKLSAEQWNCYYRTEEEKPEGLRVVGRTTRQRGDKHKLTAVLWSTDYPETFCTHNLDYQRDNGKGIVYKVGMYFVYTQVTFHIPETAHLNYVYVGLWRETQGHQSLLSKSMETVGSGSAATVTIFIGDMFYLRAGDRVMVKTYTAQYILPSEQANFFGVIKLA